ncbi:serine/threonine-protein kinase [Myxococcus sp. RHSTA-1-4]|uniref:serine/threonine-protein kinase n=1 Tax=Myxococcus sp. RHSTA-1-4 TaxID=2874601 RepID=UPI001CBE4FDB|nr:serine/threonine-protein kinase [Myxococcus sp. RHSTA-1-4]MBZ4422094.1 serine/threonine protein kinase [Myxococcus sp. RHSTA-1-4]
MSATYRLTGRIESGELAELYEGLQLPAGEVVVKLFHPKTSDPAYALDLAETTRLLQPVRHPGILHVVDIGVVRQRLAVIREDLDGFTLGTALQRLHTKEVVLPPPVALYIVIQLLEAVQQAHEAGVLHGALTPGNVVLSRDGTPAVCDFGALRALMAVPQLRRSFAGRGRGTYRSPEVARGEAYTEQSDVYSLGAIAYELLTQREPVVAGGGGVSTRRSEALPPPSRLDRRINGRLDPLILRALESAPQRRFRSCGEFASSLRNFLSASGGMPGPDDVRRFVSELFPNEVSLASLGPAPFKEPFTLEPISGAEMDDLHAEEPEASIIQRAPFSRSLSEDEASAETQEAAEPAFEEYRPEDYEPAPATRTRAPSQPPEAVGEGEITGPGQAGPLERGWEAPPGAAPPKPRRQLVPQGGTGGGQQPTRVGARNPRVKVVEDFSGPSPSEEDEELSVSISTSGRRTVRPRRPKPAEERGPRPLPEPFPSRRGTSRERDDIALPPPSGVDHAAASRRLMTEEQNLSRAASRRGRMVAIAGAIALVGVFSFVVAAWQLGGQSGTEAPVEEPAGPPPLQAQVPPPAEPVPATPPVEPPPAPEPGPPAHAADAAPEEEDAPEMKAPPKSQRAYVTITTNVPARVYIDGERVNRRTPLTRFPIKAGTRLIRLVSVTTGEPQEMELRFTRGQHRKVVVDSFSSVPRR